MGYTKETVKGMSWLGISRLFIRLIAFGRIAVIARMLTPAQLGVFGVASLVLTFTEIITETGINIVLLQEKNNINRYINTAWIISITRGILISFVIFFSAPFVAAFFSAPDATLLLRLISLVPFIRGFINPSIILFHKNLRFDYEFYYRTALYFTDSLLAVILTIIFKSPVGIVGGFIGGVVLEVILSFIVVKPTPSLQFHKSIFRYIVHKGKWVTAAGVFNYLFENGDDIVIGKILGTTALGLYDTAYRISMLPITEVSDVVAKVTLPIYVKIVDNKKRLLRGFIKAVALTSILLLPVGFIFFFFPKEIIRIVLGPQWVMAAPILQVLGIYGILRAIVLGTTQPLFYAVKKQDIVMKINILSFGVLIISIFFLIQKFGLLGAAYSPFIATVFSIPYVAYSVFSVLRHSPSRKK